MLTFAIPVDNVEDHLALLEWATVIMRHTDEQRKVWYVVDYQMEAMPEQLAGYFVHNMQPVVISVHANAFIVPVPQLKSGLLRLHADIERRSSE